MTDNTPPPQVWPTLRARDARALIRFLVDAFGFEETVVYGDGDRVHHAQLSWPPGGGIMLGSVPRGQRDDDWPLPPGTFGAYVVTDDPDGLFARATAAGRRGASWACTTPTTARATSPSATRRATAGRSAPTAASPARRADLAVSRTYLTGLFGKYTNYSSRSGNWYAAPSQSDSGGDRS